MSDNPFLNIDKFIETAEPEALDALEEQILVTIARNSYSYEGFESFFRIVFQKELTEQGKSWVKSIFMAALQNKGTVIEAFRGSAKTTTLTIAFTSYFIAHHPTTSNLLIQVGDDIANNNSSAVANIVEHNLGWKEIFPYIEPDFEHGWGQGGYEVKRNDITYGEWRQMNADRKDPTLIGLGYRSRAIIGKRPTGILIIDDILDENNTSSAKELATVLKIVQGTIFPCRRPETTTIFVGTPWTKNDVLAYVKATGRYISCVTPVVKEIKIEDRDITREEAFERYNARLMKRHVGTKEISYWAVPMWDQFTWEVIDNAKTESGSTEFARMYLLDLEAAEGLILKREWLHYYPSENIGASWPTVYGVDYASTQDKLTEGKRDFFAMATAKLIPGGGVVICGGRVAHFSQGEAEEYLRLRGEADPYFQRIGMEAIGKGEEFYYLMLRTCTLAIKKITHGRKSKAERFEKAMAPLFEGGRVWISTEQDEFLKRFVDEWIGYPGADHDDCIDAVYMALAACKGQLKPPPEDRNELPGRYNVKKVNPFGLLGG